MSFMTLLPFYCFLLGMAIGAPLAVALGGGAGVVCAVEGGSGLVAGALRRDDGGVAHDRTNIRDLTLDVVGQPVDVVVGDLSFISLELVLDALLGVTAPDGELALMVKPQFEVGNDRVGKGGVVRDLDLRVEAVTGVADAAVARGWGAVAVTVSPLPGPSGNVEFFLLLRRGPASVGEPEIRAEVERNATLGASPSVPGERVDP